METNETFRRYGRLAPMVRIPHVWEGRYVPTLLTALLSLTPFIIATTAAGLFRDRVSAGTGLAGEGVQFVEALATAGYAFGALLGGDLINRFPQRRLFLITQALAVIAWAGAAAAPTGWIYGTGLVLAGFATGLLLVFALPPTIQRYPPERAPVTVAFIDIALFGAVAAGPLIGGLCGGPGAWRWLTGGFAALGTATFAVAWLTLPETPPVNPGLPLDRPALILGLGAASLPFAAVGVLAATGFAAPAFLVPMAAGLACLAGLLVVEYRKEEPLAPVKPMWKTYPLAGLLVATFGGGVFVTATRLLLEDLHARAHAPALTAGAAFWPQTIGVLVASVLLGALFRTRFLAVLTFGGMLLLTAGIGLLSLPGAFADPPLRLLATGLLGLGAGATVSPGLFMAGLSLPSNVLGRIVALIELVRSIGDFMIAPVMSRLAVGVSGAKPPDVHSLHLAMTATLGLAAVSTVLCLALFLAGAPLLTPRPDLKAWIEQKQCAFISPPLFARLARGAGKARAGGLTPEQDKGRGRAR